MIGQFISELAESYPNTKFLRSIGTGWCDCTCPLLFLKIILFGNADVIPNYPDQNLPTIILYHEGKNVQHLVGLPALGGARTSAERESQAKAAFSAENSCFQSIRTSFETNLPELALILNKFGPFCSLAGDQDNTAEQEAQVRSLVQKLVQNRIENDDADENSDFDS